MRILFTILLGYLNQCGLLKDSLLTDLGQLEERELIYLIFYPYPLDGEYILKILKYTYEHRLSTLVPT